ncbi:unnamed protein product [Prorocentrum cordatum]|uniref:SH3 domain-containing protein n=1 Tax=Prorocentrum cordatum TaxID=2364126 RepID=A0ABN9R5T6_9DINO|nr:unnamed protein product [Polarella glacialis]
MPSSSSAGDKNSRSTASTSDSDKWEKQSTGSTGSKSSVGSIVSRFSSASSAFRKKLTGLGKSDADVWRPGDTCETIARVTARADEDLTSEVVGEIMPGITLWILEVAEHKRLKITNKSGSQKGWISCRTQLNDCGSSSAARISSLSWPSSR